MCVQVCLCVFLADLPASVLRSACELTSELELGDAGK